MAQFYSFPRTAHIEGSETVDDDRVLKGPDFRSYLLGDPTANIIAQEKMDGTNVSVHFETEWTPCLQKRSGVISSGDQPQYQSFRDYVFEHLPTFNSLLGTRYVIFGEWLHHLHGISYVALPSYFFAFDLYDKEAKRWLTRTEFETVVNGELTIVPVVQSWTAADADEARGILHHIRDLSQVQSLYGEEQREGVYLRFEIRGELQTRLKYRRAHFQAGRGDFHRHAKFNTVV
eukprot:TRINITY_DN9338_c0_g1_i1.p1 TRINITY_DN9338_c0_g1~~TRINITY_DN9338_c0_g1_i1.p1  ORF type:complete len:240 (+),score=23.11 TRINITY_DN9338_c0_g1_i1:27-722(+)